MISCSTTQAGRACFIPRWVGRLIALEAELTESQPMSHVRWHAVTLILTGDLDYHYTAVPEGTRFRVGFAAELPLLLRPLGPVLAPPLRWRLQGYLRTLRRVAKTEG